MAAQDDVLRALQHLQHGRLSDASEVQGLWVQMQMQHAGVSADIDFDHAIEFVRLCGIHHLMILDGPCRLMLLGIIQGQCEVTG